METSSVLPVLAIVLTIAGLAVTVFTAAIKVSNRIGEWKGSNESQLEAVNKTLVRIEDGNDKMLAQIDKLWNHHGELDKKVHEQSREIAVLQERVKQPCPARRGQGEA